MAGSSQYFVRNSVEGKSFLEFGYSFGTVNMDGEDVAFVGSSLTDVVAVTGDVSLNFSDTRDGADVIYLPETWSAYSKKKASLTLTLTEQTDSSARSFVLARGKVQSSDVVVFADGEISANSAWTNASVSDPGLLSSHTSLQPQIPELVEVEVDGFARAAQSGSVFASFRSGVSLKVTGSNNVDVVYVQDGGQVDARDLREGRDLIYLRGRWSDYEKSRSSSLMQFRREVEPGKFEEVTISRAKEDAKANLILFADGAILSSRAFAGANITEFSSIDGYRAPVDGNDLTATPLGDAPVDGPTVQSFGTNATDGLYSTSATVQITATMDREVTAGSHFDVTLDTGAVVRLSTAVAGTQLTGDYVIAAQDQSGDLTVTSFTAGMVTDTSDKPMVSTALPAPANNIAANHDIVINGLALTSAVDGATNVDVRSDLVLEVAGKSLKFGDDGSYQIELIDTTDGNGTIKIDLTLNAGAVDVATGGSVTITDGRLVINPDADLDLNTQYTIKLPTGFVQDAAANVPAAMVGAGVITFTTVEPTVAGVGALRWDPVAGTMNVQSTWYDGTGGNYLLNEIGLNQDLGSVAGVVLDNGGRTLLQNFGDDDLLYVDQSVLSTTNTPDETEISVVGNMPGNRTLLSFSGLDGPAAVFISFADNPATPANESELFADAFSRAALEAAGLGFLKSFEDITTVSTPVISG